MRTFLALFVLAASSLHAQAIRYDWISSTTNSSCASGALCPILAIPGTTVNVCTGTPATLTACLSSPATTYTNAGAGTSCATTSQLTPGTGGACLSTSDNQGNFGWWILPGSYSYFLTIPRTAGGGSYGPYPFSLGASTGCPSGFTCDVNYATLALACSAAGSGSLFVSIPWNGLASQTFACNMMFGGNGRVQPASGQVVTISGTITAAAFKIFDYAVGGTVALAQGRVSIEWWGTNAAALSNAYGALPSVGGTVAVNSGLTFAVAGGSTFTYTSGKGVNLDLQNQQITCSNTSGTCLTVSPTLNGGTPTVVSIRNGVISYSGASNTIVGLSIKNGADTLGLYDLQIQGFTTTGSWCYKQDNAENILAENVSCVSSRNGFLWTNFSTDSKFINCRANTLTGVGRRLESQATSITFVGFLTQGVTNVHGTEIDSTVGGPINGITEIAPHDESVGDGTANSRVYWASANASHAINKFQIIGGIANAGVNGALGTVIQYTGDGSALVSQPSVHNLQNGGHPHTVTVASTQSAELTFEGGSPEYCDNCINITDFNNGNLISGISFYPAGGHLINLWAGDGNQRGALSVLSLSDITAGTVPMTYLPSTGKVYFTGFGTATNCSALSIAANAACAAASSGLVTIQAGNTSVQVNTTAVTATSRIFLTTDQTVTSGGQLSVTCNTQSPLVLGPPELIGKGAGSFFQIGIAIAPTTNPMCINYVIIN